MDELFLTAPATVLRKAPVVAAPRRRDPFLIEGPALISFSGGRTSGYMLRRILDAHGGTLPPDVHVVFANTGKELPETLEFVRECGERWGVRVRWLEYVPPRFSAKKRARMAETGDTALLPYLEVVERYSDRGWREVTFESASREGEPFEALIVGEKSGYLPNPTQRFCTSKLKVLPMKAFMAQTYDHWTKAVGFRSDEPRRVAKARGKQEPDEDYALPLDDAGVVKFSVLVFWAGQPFDLELEDGEGNCDLCMLKGLEHKLRMVRKRPHTAAWWQRQEARKGGRFRKDGPAYVELIQLAEARPPLSLDDDLSLADCVCGD